MQIFAAFLLSRLQCFNYNIFLSHCKAIFQSFTKDTLPFTNTYQKTDAANNIGLIFYNISLALASATSIVLSIS